MGHFNTAGFVFALFLFLGTANAEDRTFKVGVSAPLSGELAEYGTAVRNGIELESENSDRSGGCLQPEYLYEDNRYSGTDGLTSFQKLRQSDHIELLFLWGEPPLNAVAPVAESNRFPVLAMSVDPTPAEHRQYILRTINRPEDYARLTLNFLRAKSLSRIGVIKSEDSFMSAMHRGLESSLSSAEEVVATFTVDPGDTDFRAIILKLKQSRVDALAVYLLPGQVANFYRQALTLQFSPQTFGTDVFESETEIESAAGGMEGAVYPNVVVPEEFRSKYFSKYQNVNQLTYAYNAYVVAQRIRLTACDLPELSGPIEILNSLARVNSSAKNVKFKDDVNDDAHYAFPLSLKVIERGSFHDVAINPLVRK